MALTTWIYPLDPTGKSKDNFVSAEPVALDNHRFRVVVLKNGAFFTDSIRIVDAASMQPLTTDQWYATIYYPQPSEQYGMPVNAALIISDPNVSPNILVDYQVVGGPYSYSQEAAATQIDNLGLDNRSVNWPNILNKPNQFPPAPHFQNFDTLYGMEYLVNAVYMLANAVQIGNAPAMDDLLKYVDQQNANQNDTINTINTSLSQHLQDTGNPHKTTAAQVGAYTTAQVDGLISNLQTSLQQQITANATEISKHEQRQDNPHVVTAAQTGAYTSAQTDTAIANAVNAAKLTFTPVQQGGGANQGTNKIFLGWDGSRPRMQVDSTDLGGLVTYNEMQSNVNNLQTQINGKQPNGNYVVQGGNANLNSIASNYMNVVSGGWLEAGYIHSRGNGQFDGTLYCNNDIWAFTSDGRFKDRIRPIDDVRARIEGLNGVFHHYNEFGREFNGLKDDREYVGFIAQDLEKNLPQAVGLAPGDRDPETGLSISGENYLTAQYERTAPLLVEASKEHYRNHDTMAKRLARLERMLGIPPENDCALLQA